MTDKELLELAAKAAGIDLHWNTSIEDGLSLPQVDGDFWCPLQDDGDALRLAVKLNFFIQMIREINYVEVTPMKKDDNRFITFGENLNNDPYAATRRAIVRAAAEIGKTL